MTTTRQTAHVLLLFGDQAEVTTEGRDHNNPIRTPAAPLAAALGVEVSALPGLDFTAEVADEEIRAPQRG